MDNIKILKDLYIKLDNKIMGIKLAYKVSETPINLHYLRSLKQNKKKILMLDYNDQASVDTIKDIIEKLLISKKNETNETIAEVAGDTDLEGTAAAIESNESGEQQHE